MVKKACKFFALGTCHRGQACKYSHDTNSSGNFQSGAVTSSPKLHLTKRIACRFDLLGHCNKGSNCSYKHSNEDMSTPVEAPKAQLINVSIPEPAHIQDAEIENYLVAPPKYSMQDLEARNLQGACVKFGSGAQVFDLEFPSDYSAVQMTSLKPHYDAEAFRNFMAMLGETVPLSSIRVMTMTISRSTIANVRIRDPGFAQRLKLKADTHVKGNRTPDITVSIQHDGVSSESSGNRLQMCTVSCTWYKPSRTAWLHYDKPSKAKAAEKFISRRDYRIAGRKIQATIQVPEHRFRDGTPTTVSVQLGNLDGFTEQLMVESNIPNHLRPTKVVMGKPSYSASLRQAEECVKSRLEEIGPLETWELNFTASDTRVKAFARFQTAEDARKAVNNLNRQKMAQLANTKLLVSPSISVKFSVPKGMYIAIRKDVDQLRNQIWEAGYVHIKTYSPADPTQKNIVARLYGEDIKAVAQAKKAFEKILAGDVAMNGDDGIWDDFFVGHEGLMYLNELSRSHKGYTYRDIRRHRLSLYGSAASKERIQSSLIEKLDGLRKMTHHIPLNADDLHKALHGGFRRIMASLGKQKAVFDIRQRPQVIIITGSARDLETAQALLDQDLASDIENLALDDKGGDRSDCVVCWTEAEDAYRTPCGHFYCKTCFSNQCTSAGDGDLPVHCLGDSGKCARVFEIRDIKNALSTETFEQLLENSFTTQVRTNPKSFQYCPTPDCQQIYRVSNTGVVFTCPACLTPVCTTCQVTAHDGMTCELYRRVGTEGNEEFRRWKEDNGIKDCPVCKVPIEKADGCNHM